MKNNYVNLSFIDQKKEIAVSLQDISVTLLIELLNDEVSSVNFCLFDQEQIVLIKKVLEVYLESKKIQTDDNIVGVIYQEVTFVAIESITETLTNLASLFKKQ